MRGMADQAYLLSTQYRDDSNLNARIRLHELFSTNAYGFYRWVFDQFEIPERARVLELGCGPGMMWRENPGRVPPGWEVVLSDFSPGMVEKARAHLSGNPAFRFARVDAQAIPYPEGTFDAVIANHMLYHVPDRARAIAEVRRVLKPGGVFYAATNGERHLREIFELVKASCPGTGMDTAPKRFSLENGGTQLSERFSTVDVRRYKDGLEVPKAEPLVAYIASWARLEADGLKRVRARIEREIAEKGVIRIQKDTGIFVAG